jgi:nucleoside-diphosphate-sugar epimerase
MEIKPSVYRNVVNCCLELGIKKLGYVSSTAIGGEGELVISEQLNDNLPKLGGYSISKYSAEKEQRGSEEGLDVVIINPCVIIGAGD